ncbi:MAG TPA: carboxypeptidase-like regulatory domain-containing protein, partial [Pyrinomonadaceae bacterium]|nr:carboxypeptidase-like regulatory domain-containing protein [Pyrinomonadaceae bacterium]
MKQIISLSQVMFLSMFVCFAASSVKSVEANNSYRVLNRIEGMVWSPYRQPVSDVYVELQTENYSTLNRVRTNSSGRFSFTVARQGNYNVKVLASGTNYLDALEPVEIVNMTPTASDNVYLDIYLKFDKRNVESGVSGITEAVFVQEVPEEARKLYKSGVKSLGDNDDKGFDEIERALKIFPDYYEALNTIGREYVQRKEYRKSLPYLIKSIDTNQ